MSATANTENSASDKTSVTTISVNARIDYIMRFSKQAVLVVDPLPEKYSHVGSDFLASLPDDHNAAFLSISSKLNDIQIRCRLVEQLYSETLFDPEQALAITILKLAKNKEQVISIVIENVQVLSLQLMHELCQLAEIAAKANRRVNVLLLGEERAAKLVANNKTVFDNKISILSAQSGQLIALNSAHLQDEKPSFFSSHWLKISLSVVIVLAFSSAILAYLYQRDNLTFTNENQIDQPVKSIVPTKTSIAAPVFVQVPSEQETIAQSSEIFTALSLTPKAEQQIQEVVISKATIAQSEKENLNKSKNKSKNESDNEKPLPIKTEQPMEQEAIVVSEVIEFSNETVNNSAVKVTPRTSSTGADYYLNKEQGYTAQLIGFSSMIAFEKFVSKYPTIEFHYYNKWLNGKKFIVVTSPIYPQKSDARSAISLLPQEIQKRGPWVKSITSIKNEINVFQSSQ